VYGLILFTFTSLILFYYIPSLICFIPFIILSISRISNWCFP
jgi:hypothetical protein